MIPQLNSDIETQNIEYELAATKTYRFDITNKRIQGMTDGLEAYKIAAEKALKTKRYAHVIYDGNYGSDLQDYVGQDFDFIKSAVQREIHETLSQDDRFQSIDNFIIQQTGLDHCIIRFNIVSTEGSFSTELEV
jgi:hypothetical protein